jgi:hypothetical protein
MYSTCLNNEARFSCQEGAVDIALSTSTVLEWLPDMW